MERRVFRAMGTEIELLVQADGADNALDAAEQEFHRLESLLSRFRTDSELSRLNRDGTIEAGHDLLRVVALSLEGRESTDGRFDPTVHDSLVAAGYDRTFDEVASVTRTDTWSPPSVGGEVTLHGARIELEAGVHLDLGGIGKGYAAERAAELLAMAGPCLVNAGGDIAVRGGSWPVGVDELTLELSDCGLATSGSDRRRWQRGERELHHLIDPKTGEPAESNVLRVTVVAADAVKAEIAAKALFLSGAEQACTEADAAGTPAVIVTTDGRTLLAGGIA
jgi:thiamine biosynthesis lipoprotein